MKIGKNTWHAKLNDYVYGNNYSYYSTNLCPYFWGTILAIVTLPFVACGKAIGNIEVDTPNIDLPHIDIPDINLPSISDETQTNIGKGLLLTVLMFVSVGLYFVGENVGWKIFFIVLGIVLGIIGAIVGAIFGIIYLQDKYNDWRYEHPKKHKSYVEPKPNMLLEFVKAWKHKHCPMLQWVE